MVSLHGTFTGEAFVYCVPKENFIAEEDRVAADWIKMHTDALTSSDPSIELACGQGYICQIRAANAMCVGGLDTQRAAHIFGVSGVSHVISSRGE